MKILILAAGIGSRLGHLTKNKPKCLLDITKNGKSILEYQLDILKKYDFDYSDVFIVVGYQFEKISYLVNGNINLIFNPKYKEYNNIYSFYLAKGYINEDFILLNGDTLFHPVIFEELLKANDGTYFVVDNIKKLQEEEMKVLIKKGRVLKFGKDIDPKKAYGEYIGIAKFSINDAKIIFKKIEKLIRNGLTNIWYELAINHVLDKIIARPVYTNGFPWIEVDTPKDYEKAKILFGGVNYL